MSDTNAHPPLANFTDAELTQLRKDDLFAGRFIGRTLILLFLCSAILMSGVVWWTYTTVSQRTETTSAKPVTLKK